MVELHGREYPQLSGLWDFLDRDDVTAVVVFGSVARGDSAASSDFDVLVVVEDRAARRALVEDLDRSHRSFPWPLVLSRDALLDEVQARPSFVSHLLDEGVVVYGEQAWNDLRAELLPSSHDEKALDRELRSRAGHLAPFARPERFVNSPVTALSQIYAIARSIVIVRLLQEDIHEYSWQRVFDAYAEVRPDLRGELQSLKALRPYYESARAGTAMALQTRPVGTDEVHDLVTYVSHLAGCAT